MENQNNPNLGAEVILRMGQDLNNLIIRKVHFETGQATFRDILPGVIRYPALVTVQGYVNTSVFFSILLIFKPSI